MTTTHDDFSFDDWTVPTKEEIQESKTFEERVLAADDYIGKVAKIELGLQPTWNNATSSYDYSKMALQYSLVILPYKLKAEEGIFDREGREVKPLTNWLWRKFSPFSIGFNQKNEPTYLRAFIMYTQGITDPNATLKMPGVIVLRKKDDSFATPEETKAYAKAVSDGKSGLISPEEYSEKVKDFKHIPDIRSLEGKYIGIRVTIGDNGKNQISSFSKVPSGFVPDETLEAEAMKKFSESYAKYMDGRDAKQKNRTASELSRQEGSKVEGQSTGGIDIEDIPF